MKVLHVVPSYKPAYIYGGPIESIASLCEALAEAGNDVSVFTTTANGNSELDVEINKEINVDNVRVIYFPRLTKGHTHVSLALWKHLYKFCKNYDIVHIHSWWNPLVVFATIICHLQGVKVVISPRGMLSKYILTETNAVIKKIIHIFLGKSALKKSIFHATSEIEYTECQNLIEDWKGFLIPNIINLPDGEFNRTSNEVFTIVFLSRIHPKKGLEYLFEAISFLNVPLNLKIAGTGETEYINQLKSYSEFLKIDHLIEWVGWKDRKEKFVVLASSDLFVLTSHNENFANVVIESLYVGTPVLLTDTVGLASYVNKNNLGWVAEFTPKSIAINLQSAITDHQKRAYVNSSSRDIIINEFSRLVLAKKYLEQYEFILNNSLSQRGVQSSGLIDRVQSL